MKKYIMTLVSLFAADSVIKHSIETCSDMETERLALGGRLCIKKYHNAGAMFNIGNKNGKLVAALSLVFSAFMSGVFAATLTTKGNILLKSGLALLLGGAYSNTYDRLKRQYVVDYVSFRLPLTQNKALGKLKGMFESVVFNISDFGIIIGAMLVVVSELLKDRELYKDENKAS